MIDLLKGKIKLEDYKYLANIAPVEVPNDRWYIGMLSAKALSSWRPTKAFTCKSCGYSGHSNTYIVVDNYDFCSNVCAGVYLRNKGEIK